MTGEVDILRRIFENNFDLETSKGRTFKEIIIFIVLVIYQ